MSEAEDRNDKDLNETGGENPKPKKQKRHWIKTTWLRRTLKTLLGIVIGLIIFVLLVPVLIYVPPVQDLLVKIAEKVVHDSTGMDAHIGKFRLKFPLDVSLQDLYAVEANGDTLVSAREVIADVKMRPLFNLDVDINKLQLNDAYYRLVSSDTSMIMTLRAGFLEVDDKSEFLVKKSDLTLNKATIRDADIQMYSDVWKKKPTPPDTTGQLLIKINDLEGERIRFGMSMLPTIDTLSIYAGDLSLKNGVIDLRKSRITAGELTADAGDVKYITPTAEYIKTHPAPVDTLYPPGPPMVIDGKKVKFSDFDVLYAIKGAKPMPGFDASYLQLSDLSLTVDNFYNESSTLRVPVQALKGKERCGLEITEGHGYFSLDSTGIYLDTLNVRTPYSRIDITAGLPFNLMELKPDAPTDISLDASVGIHDILAFMPSLKSITKFIPGSGPINLLLDTHGTLSNIEISDLNLGLPSILSLKAKGAAANPLDFKKIIAHVQIDGSLYKPEVVEKFTGKMPFKIPRLQIKGTAGIDRQSYSANLAVLTSQGNVAAKGSVNLNSERYNADLDVTGLNVGYFLPDLGVGKVTASLQAEGNGFNPLLPKATTDVDLYVKNIAYKGMPFNNITLTAKLGQNNYDVYLNSPNKDADINLRLDGSINNGTYAANGYLNCSNIDLQALGFDKATNHGSFNIELDGTATPDKWLYDVDLSIHNFFWNLPDQTICLPDGIDARLIATAHDVALNLDCQETTLAFESPENIPTLINKFTKSATLATSLIDKRELMVDSLQRMLPKFDLAISTPGNGLIDQVLADKEISLDSIKVNLRNDSIFSGFVDVLGLQTGATALDTITLNLQQRNYLLDYKLHLGNRPGTLDEFADVNLNGYLGGNRLSAYLNQKNLAGENGYRIGFTAALVDSLVTVHFTPLNAMIGYKPWTLNADNYVDVNLKNYKIEADLMASSNESSIELATRPGADDLQELDLKLANIHVEDFLQLSPTSPQFSATVNANIRARYDGKELVGMGRVGLTDLSYNKTKIDDLNLMMQASMNEDGTYDVAASLAVDKLKSLTVSSKLVTGEEGLEPEFVKLDLDKFPLSVANAFLGNDVASLEGSVSGEMDLTGGFTKPILNGSLSCDSVQVYLPIMGSSLKFDSEPLTVTDNVIRFNRFDIWGANKNPLTIDGTVDATKFNDIILDITANANDFQLVGNDRRAGSDLYGKLFLNFDASAKGALTHFDVNASLNILGATDVYYTLPDANTAIAAQKENDVVKFVNFSDTIQAEEAAPESVFMRVNANVSITPGAEVTVNLSNNGTDKVQLNPSGSVSLYRNFMGDITLNGQIYTGNGFARYNVPVIGEKEFVFNPESYVLFNGPMMNPTLSIKATDTEKVSVSQSGGNSRLVNFLVGLTITGTLNSPNLLFDLSTDDDLTIENQLQGMSADQRNSAAMNLLVTGQYSAGDISTNSGPFVGNVYNFLTQQLNSWAAKNIRGVDLSFGVNQYNMTENGETNTTTSYSYQLSKSLFDNRFKISIGGNYSTNDSPDDNLTQNLISDISFEYIISQTQYQTMLVKLFRHNGYESILEGEITETGAGFVYKRKIGDFRQFFNTRRRRKKAAAPADSTAVQTDSTAGSPQTVRVNSKP